MKKLVAASVAALLIAAPAPLAFAFNDDGQRSAPAVTLDEAIAIAEANGLVRVTEVELDDGEWEIEGCTADGHEIEVDVHAQTGRLIKLEIDKDDFC